jgi:hypothetical protein
LAQMTGVPLTWLRYGLAERRDAAAPAAAEARTGRYEQADKSSVTPEELRLLTQLRLMSTARRVLVQQLGRL